MAKPRKAPEKKDALTLIWEDGYWWIIGGPKKENVGRSRRYAEKLLSDKETKK